MEPYLPKARKTPPPPTPDPQGPPERHDEYSILNVTVAAFTGLGFALSARALLLLALIGAFVLAVLAAMAQTTSTLYVLIAFSILVVLPVTCLEFFRRSAG